jgi:uncharacterized membrane protein YsdA (DUF1294 family)
MQTYFVYWLIFVNGFSFLQIIYDKHLAVQQKRRIPEASLLGWMFLGGALGGLLASRIVRHKTRKQPFAGNMLALAILWVLGAVLWYLDYLEPLMSYVEPLITQALAIIADAT